MAIEVVLPRLNSYNTITFTSTVKGIDITIIRKIYDISEELNISVAMYSATVKTKTVTKMLAKSELIIDEKITS